MRVQFCGANRTVTGSCHLVEIGGRRIFLDSGMYQGPRAQARRLNEWLPDGIHSADAVILSHGHLDHCGKLPILTKGGYSGPIYCTPATAEVARVVLEDSAEIQEEDAAYLNRRAVDPTEPPILPLYRPADVQAVLRAFQRVEYGRRTDLGDGVAFTFYDAGHILGSAYIVLEWRENGRERKLLYTADVGRYNSPIIRDPQPLPGPVDHVITESTYGDRSHAPIAEVEPALLEAVQHCIQRRSRMIVPAFAVGRTQTVLWYVQKFIKEKRIPEIPIFIDSPMGIEVTDIHRRFDENYDAETRKLIGNDDLFGLSRVTFTRTAQESRKINSHSGACVIIASSPTCEFGRVLHHLKQSIENPDDLVVFVGWTPGYTLGRKIQDGLPRVRIFNRWYEVKIGVRTIHGLSAHADRDELIRFLTPTLTTQTSAHIVHGEADQAEGLAASLLENGIGRALVPAMETSLIVP